MKAMILAAGLGTRLLPLTQELPKPVFPVLGKSLLEFTLERLKEAGVNEVVINLHHLPVQIERRIGNGKKFGMKINYSFEPQILGSGGGLKKAEPMLSGGAFFLVNGDILIDIDLKKVLQFHREKKAFATMVLREDREVEKYGAISIDRSLRVRQFLGSPPRNGAKLRKLMFTGIHLLEPEIFQYIPEGVFSNINRITYPKILEEKPIFGYPFQGFWRECGHPEEYYAVNMERLKKEGSRKPKKTPQCRFVPPVWVGEDCRFGQRSVVGPWAVVGAGCRIGAGAKITRSILWDGVCIPAGEKIDRAIVGKKDKVKLKPSALRRRS